MGREGLLWIGIFLVSVATIGFILLGISSTPEVVVAEPCKYEIPDVSIGDTVILVVKPSGEVEVRPIANIP